MNTDDFSTLIPDEKTNSNSDAFAWADYALLIAAATDKINAVSGGRF